MSCVCVCDKECILCVWKVVKIMPIRGSKKNSQAFQNSKP